MPTPRWIDGPQQFITAKDVANYLGTSLDYAYKLCRNARKIKFPVKKFPPFERRNESQNKTRQHIYRIPKQEFLEWVDNFGKD